MRKFILIVASFSLIAIACQNASRDPGAMASDKMMMEQTKAVEEAVPAEEFQDTEVTPPTEPPAPPPGKPEEPGKVNVPRQIIKTANYRMQVKDVNTSSQNAVKLAGKHGGYVSESALTNSSYEITNAITIRVPAARFDSLMNDLGGDALFVQYKRVSSEDVTEEYVDITTRLKTKKEVRDRYIDILRNKARTVQDVLKAEEQIRVIQEEIEAKEGRLRYLMDQVAMSTINLELYQSIEYKPEPSAFHESFWSKVLTGLKNGWELMQGIVLFFINIWPITILLALIWWKRKWLWSRIRRK